MYMYKIQAVVCVVFGDGELCHIDKHMSLI
jgi:hypothetical protein